MTYKTTRKDYKYFSERVKYWQEKFNLGDWRIELCLEELEDVMAECQMWYDSHGAHVRMNTNFPNPIDRQYINKLALHEVCHILLADFRRLANERIVTNEMLTLTEHAIVRRLETLLCET
jgi:hypothetical protein